MACTFLNGYVPGLHLPIQEYVSGVFIIWSSFISLKQKRQSQREGNKLLVHLIFSSKPHLCLSANVENKLFSCLLTGVRRNGHTEENCFVSVVVWRYFAVEETMAVTSTKLSLCNWGETSLLTFFRSFSFLWCEIHLLK